MAARVFRHILRQRVLACTNSNVVDAKDTSTETRSWNRTEKLRSLVAHVYACETVYGHRVVHFARAKADRKMSFHIYASPTWCTHILQCHVVWLVNIQNTCIMGMICAYTNQYVCLCECACKRKYNEIAAAAAWDPPRHWLPTTDKQEFIFFSSVVYKIIPNLTTIKSIVQYFMFSKQREFERVVYAMWRVVGTFSLFLFFRQGYRSAYGVRISFRLQMIIHLFLYCTIQPNSHTFNESIFVFQPGIVNLVMRNWYRRIQFLWYGTVFRFNAIKVNINDAQSERWQKLKT